MTDWESVFKVNATSLSLQAYHQLILQQRHEQHQELISALRDIHIALNDLVKATIVRKKK